MDFSAKAEAFSYSPANSRRRISGRAEAEAGLLLSIGQPAQRLSSFNWIRSFPAPPKTMPPSRPFPTGRASTHSRAGCRYQSRGDAAGVPAGAGSDAAADETISAAAMPRMIRETRFFTRSPPARTRSCSGPFYDRFSSHGNPSKPRPASYLPDLRRGPGPDLPAGHLRPGGSRLGPRSPGRRPLRPSSWGRVAWA